jgi:hypothetical protein
VDETLLRRVMAPRMMMSMLVPMLPITLPGLK